MTMFPTLLTGLLMLAGLVGCRPPAQSGALPTTQMQLGSQTLTLEIANTGATREHGLMQRDSMPADHGMIFVFADEQSLSFWMKKTRIPLDVIYVDGNQKVVSIKQMKPYDLTPVPSGRAAKWAIELNKGAADTAGVKVGDQLAIPQAAQKVAD
jgi:uncharacterized membrane protein (UPF0127 family)